MVSPSTVSKANCVPLNVITTVRSLVSSPLGPLVITTVMDGGATPAQIGAFLVALRMKGETVDEITGAVRALREHAVSVRPAASVIVDTCGTGGDGRGTFNVSTAAALIAAAAGVTVAKHGNRAMSGKVGGADVLHRVAHREGVELGRLDEAALPVAGEYAEARNSRTPEPV